VQGVARAVPLGGPQGTVGLPGARLPVRPVRDWSTGAAGHASPSRAPASRADPARGGWAVRSAAMEHHVESSVGELRDRVRLEALRDCVRPYILRRTKEEVATDMPPRVIRDAYLELTPAQREAYERAEKEGVIQLNALGETLTVQHVFELVMRLKQICNFDPATGQNPTVATAFKGPRLPPPRRSPGHCGLAGLTASPHRRDFSPKELISSRWQPGSRFFSFFSGGANSNSLCG